MVLDRIGHRLAEISMHPVLQRRMFDLIRRFRGRHNSAHRRFPTWFEGTPVYSPVGRRLPIWDRTTCFIAVYTYAVSAPMAAA